jgi:hypothetical protein
MLGHIMNDVPGVTLLMWSMKRLQGHQTQYDFADAKK